MIRASLTYWGEYSASMSWSIGRSEIASIVYPSLLKIAKTALPES
jgi:hypothetical protein